MRLTTFFLNGSTQVTNLDSKFFLSERKNKDGKYNVLPPLDIEQKARTLAQSIATEHYYNHHLEYNELDLQTDFN
jgi:hypothetical protein